MTFDPFRRRPISNKPHVVAPADGPGVGAYCVNCGATGWDIAFDGSACDPDGDAAKKFRREKRDAMVGRVTGNS